MLAFPHEQISHYTTDHKVGGYQHVSFIRYKSILFFRYYVSQFLLKFYCNFETFCSHISNYDCNFLKVANFENCSHMTVSRVVIRKVAGGASAPGRRPEGGAKILPKICFNLYMEKFLKI